MSGNRPSASRRTGRLVTAFGLLAAGISLFTACAGGTPVGSGDQPEPSDAILGTWGSTGERQPHLVFDNGSVTGTDGCNGISTTYSVDGDTITLSRFMSTKMACPGVDTWLQSVRTVELDGDALLVRNAAGDHIGTLERN